MKATCNVSNQLEITQFVTWNNQNFKQEYLDEWKSGPSDISGMNFSLLVLDLL